MAKRWESAAYTVTVEDEGDHPEGGALSDKIEVTLHKTFLSPFEAIALGDALIRAMHEVLCHRLMRKINAA